MAKLSLTKVGYVMQSVSNMEKALDFYQNTLELPVSFQDSHWAELNLEGGVKLALHFFENMTTARSGEHQTRIVFSVDDIRSIYETLLDKGVQASKLKKVAEMGNVVGVSTDFADPDGNALSVYGTLPASEWVD